LNIQQIKEWGARLRLRRLRARLSQADLGIRADLHQSQISLFESGQLQIRPNESKRITQALAVRMRELQAIKIALKNFHAEDASAAL